MNAVYAYLGARVFCAHLFLPLLFTSVFSQWCYANKSELVLVAERAFRRKDYDKAIVYYRRHLNKFPRDYEAVDALAASFYHTGLPKRALKKLKYSQSRTKQRSYNFYYQGLSYLMIDKEKSAKRFFQYAARNRDQYGERAVFELALIEYKNRQFPKSRYWLLLYNQRFPKGVYSKQVEIMLESSSRGEVVENIKGTEKPDKDRANYRYNSLSLFDYPHFWILQLGSSYDINIGQDPSLGGLKTRTSANQAILANAGIGVGPLKSGNTDAWAGYTYRQRWLTDDTRLNEFLDDPTDFSYQPFRPDLLERRHDFFGDMRHTLTKNFVVGAFAKFQFARIGSNLDAGPDIVGSEESRVFNISDTQLLIPWVGANYLKNYRTTFYLYLRKEINGDNAELSNQSYIYPGSDDSTMSFGLVQTFDFMNEYQMTVNVELFQYEFVYNDYWLDYSRTGIIVGSEHRILPGLYMNFKIGQYEDAYQVDRISQSGCSTVGTVGSDATGQRTPRFCSRTDTGLIIQMGAYYNFSQSHRIGAEFTFVENENSQLKEYNNSTQEFVVMASMAFPSVKRVVKFVDRVSDVVFTKEAK